MGRAGGRFRPKKIKGKGAPTDRGTAEEKVSLAAADRLTDESDEAGGSPRGGCGGTIAARVAPAPLMPEPRVVTEMGAARRGAGRRGGGRPAPRGPAIRHRRSRARARYGQQK